MRLDAGFAQDALVDRHLVDAAPDALVRGIPAGADAQLVARRDSRHFNGLGADQTPVDIQPDLVRPRSCTPTTWYQVAPSKVEGPFESGKLFAKPCVMNRNVSSGLMPKR